MEQSWSRELFQAYCRRLATGKLNPKIPGKVVPAAVFMAELDRNFATVGDVTADTLLAQFTPEYLRRHSSVVSFLAEALNLKFSVSGFVEADGRRRLKTVKKHQVDSPWKSALDDYEKFLRSEDRKRPLSDRTISTYLRVSAALFASARKEKPEEIINKDIAKFVQIAPGAAASLTAFVRYLRVKFSVSLQNPEVRRTTREKREQRLVGSVSNSLEALRATNKLSEAKVHIARLLSCLYGYRLKDVLGIRKVDLEITDDRIFIRVLPDEEPQQITGEMFGLARPWIDRLLAGKSGNPFLFEGRSARRPMVEAGLAYYGAG